MKLILVRGPAGSGKATICKQLGGIRYKNWFDPDFYWYVLGNGHYRFDPGCVDDAAVWCFEQCQSLAQSKLDLIVVSSTDPALESVETYEQLAEEYGYEFSVVRTPGPWHPEALMPRHRTPGRILRRQIDQYEAHESESEW